MSCRFFHDWGEWKKMTDKCIRERTCKRCQKIQTEVISHDFTEWTYVDCNGCKQERECRHCHFKEERTEHVFGQWHYYEDECCTMKRVCGRCGKTEFKESHNHEIKDVPGKCIKKSVCPRCHDTRVISIDHDWEESITKYKDCLNYVINTDKSEISKIQEEIKYILEDNKGDMSDIRYVKLAAKKADLEHDIVVCNIKFKNASEYTGGRVCKKCRYIKIIGRKDHFDS